MDNEDKFHGCVYKLTTPDGKFYIGSTIQDISNYIGSGVKWLDHLKRNNYSNFDLKKEILKEDFSSEEEMRKYEDDLIASYFKTDSNGKKHKTDENIMNSLVGVALNPTKSREKNKCPECGVFFNHKKTCSRYKKHKPCSECGWIDHHKKSCSKYNAPKPCPECGTVHGHTKDCSRAKRCPECNSFGYVKTCSKYYKNKKGMVLNG